MGCNQSKIENEEAVSRCKDRKLHMKEAVSTRNAFAAAHSSYAMALKNTGAALNDYAQAEIPPHLSSFSSAPSSSAAAPAPPPPLPSLFPPPPPDHLDLPPLQRAVSMPEMKIAKAEMKPVEETINEEEEMEFEAHDNERLVRKRSSSSNRGSTSSNKGSFAQENHVQQQSQYHHHHHQQQHQDSTFDFFFPPVDSIPGPSLAEPAVEEEVKVNKAEVERQVFEEKLEPPPPVVVEEEGKVEKAVEVPVMVAEKKVGRKVGGGEGGRRVVKGMNFMQIFEELDDNFLKTSESAHEVSKMLEATRLHYHSNFADNRGNVANGFSFYYFIC